ncbi:MAG TPA: hypothetical protein VKP88_00230 [Candidatus Paceibacterota bacterium]|nr:hypothetical protein [Candidatus Paceibacterota bacterium]
MPKRSRKTLVHVNQHNIKANHKGGDKPVLTVKQYDNNRKTNSANVYLGDTLVGKFIYSPDKPLSCGATVWFETYCDVEVSDNDD